MHVNVTIKGLTEVQWGELDYQLKTAYHFPDHEARVCALFKRNPMLQRHVEFPMSELTRILAVLELIERGERARAGHEIMHLESITERRPALDISDRWYQR